MVVSESKSNDLGAGVMELFLYGEMVNVSDTISYTVDGKKAVIHL